MLRAVRAPKVVANFGARYYECLPKCPEQLRGSSRPIDRLPKANLWHPSTSKEISTRPRSEAAAPVLLRPGHARSLVDALRAAGAPGSVP